MWEALQRELLPALCTVSCRRQRVLRDIDLRGLGWSNRRKQIDAVYKTRQADCSTEVVVAQEVLGEIWQSLWKDLRNLEMFKNSVKLISQILIFEDDCVVNRQRLCQRIELW